MNILVIVAYLVAILALAYVLFILPQRRRSKQARELLNRLRPGQEVVTAGGIYGTVRECGSETVMLEVATGVEMKIATRAVVRVVDPTAQGASDDARDGDSSDGADDHGRRRDGKGDLATTGARGE